MTVADVLAGRAAWSVVRTDARAGLAALPDGSVHLAITSPPYWGQRAYHAGPGELGSEALHDCLAWARAEPPCGPPGCWVCNLRAVFGGRARNDGVWRVLRDGLLVVDVGDSYAGGGKGSLAGQDKSGLTSVRTQEHSPVGLSKIAEGLRAKSLCLMPERLTLALQADGWIVRSVPPWFKRNCLSGGTFVHARTQKGDMPMMVKDLVRLNPETVQLWNGERWTRCTAWEEAGRPDDVVEIELRSGERIGCTRDHRWPTARGLVAAGMLCVGDLMAYCDIPEPAPVTEPSQLDSQKVGRLIGLYIAEGSRWKGTLQIAGHEKEEERWAFLEHVAKAFHGTASLSRAYHGHAVSMAIRGPVLIGLIDTYVAGRFAIDKHLTTRCWQRENAFLRSILDGYLEGDGSWDANNMRWRVVFCANDYWARDLRAICARLAISLRLRRGTVPYNGTRKKIWRGDIRLLPTGRKGNSGSWQIKPDHEIVAIRKSRARKFWDITVADEPHLFALSSGVLTHNSMPESADDRPVTAHEYLILASKRGDYFWDGAAIGVSAAFDGRHDTRMKGSDKYADGSFMAGANEQTVHARGHERWTMRLSDGTRGRSYRTSDPYRGEIDAAIADATARLVALRRIRDGDGLDLDDEGVVQALYLATTPSDYDYCSACASFFEGPARRQVKVRRVRNPAHHPIAGGNDGHLASGHERAQGNAPFLSVARTCPCGRDDAWIDHYAAFGENLIRPFILAGCPERCCVQCGAGWVREVETVDPNGRLGRGYHDHSDDLGQGQRMGSAGIRAEGRPYSRTLGWRPSCACGCAETVPGIVLDPFAGTGTSVLCAARLGRRGIGLELSPSYVALARARVAAGLAAPLLPAEPVEEQGALL